MYPLHTGRDLKTGNQFGFASSKVRVGAKRYKQKLEIQICNSSNNVQKRLRKYEQQDFWIKT
jgi:hypothetical protein